MFKPEQLCLDPLLLTTDHFRTQVFGSAVIRGGTTNVNLKLLTDSGGSVVSWYSEVVLNVSVADHQGQRH